MLTGDGGRVLEQVLYDGAAKAGSQYYDRVTNSESGGFGDWPEGDITHRFFSSRGPESGVALRQDDNQYDRARTLYQFQGATMYWLNIDIPTKKCTLHASRCTTKPAAEPRFKGFGSLKRDGGWLSFDTQDAAAAYFKQTWQGQGYQWRRCPYC